METGSAQCGIFAKDPFHFLYCISNRRCDRTCLDHIICPLSKNQWKWVPFGASTTGCRGRITSAKLGRCEGFLATDTPGDGSMCVPTGYGCQLVDNDNYRDWKREESGVLRLAPFANTSCLNGWVKPKAPLNKWFRWQAPAKHTPPGRSDQKVWLLGKPPKLLVFCFREGLESAPTRSWCRYCESYK